MYFLFIHYLGRFCGEVTKLDIVLDSHSGKIFLPYQSSLTEGLDSFSLPSVVITKTVININAIKDLFTINIRRRILGTVVFRSVFLLPRNYRMRKPKCQSQMGLKRFSIENSEKLKQLDQKKLLQKTCHS